MSGRSVNDLGKPSLPYRVDRRCRGLCGFETLKDSRKEDLFRAKRLRKATKCFPEEIEGPSALALGAQLERAGNGDDVPASLSSSTTMRGLRINIIGAVWSLIMMVGLKALHGFTIIPATWEFSADELPNVNPVWLMNSLRAALYARGARKAKGWIIAFIHGEWDPIGKIFRLHVHGLAYGDMVEVIDRLRKLPNYKTQKYLKDGTLSPVYRRIKMTRKPLTNLPRPITYLLQSYWPQRALFISDDGARRRARRKRRIAEPQHSQVLLWLDKWNIRDLTLMVGLRVTKTGLQQTKPVS